ncbi:MAG: Hsp20/alpha crystallin family protein [Candidatus Pacebacteria bacterium]|nr:Hsp20/alpha crystallin family protein [Candidatus Paceibacterota bacterium]
MKKPSFLERLTGNQSEDMDRILDDEHEFGEDDDLAVEEESEADEEWENEAGGAPQDGELPVDMYQTDDMIVIRALVAGVSPAELEISITRDMVTLRGVREEYQEASDDGYFHRELFWGSFSRTLLLPEEVAIDEAEAQEKHGLLEIKLPKLDKHRTTQLKVRSNAGHK